MAYTRAVLARVRNQAAVAALERYLAPYLLVLTRLPPVAFMVTKRIVHLLEMVNINQHKGKRLAIAFGIGH